MFYFETLTLMLLSDMMCPKFCMIFGKVCANISATGSSVLTAIFFRHGIKNKTNFWRLDGLKQIHRDIML